MVLSYAIHRIQAAGYSFLARITRKRCYGYETMKPHFQRKSGLEFGGPSSIFSANHLIPIYEIVGSITNCNFAQQTIWTSKKDHLRFGAPLQRQLIVEACNAFGIANDSYDFVVASHVLEHVANPLRALQEWKRIVKPSGTILVVVPHRAGMFDHRRPFTTFDHVKADFESNVTEMDLTHLSEILELHDLELDPPAGSPAQFRERCLRNFSTRAMHHHVFSSELLVEMFSSLQMQILNIAVEHPYHIIVHAMKGSQDDGSNLHQGNAAFLKEAAGWRNHDPFRTSEGSQG